MAGAECRHSASSIIGPCASKLACGKSQTMAAAASNRRPAALVTGQLRSLSHAAFARPSGSEFPATPRHTPNAVQLRCARARDLPCRHRASGRSGDWQTAASVRGVRKRLAAPQCAVTAEPNAVPGKHQPVAVIRVFGSHGTGMCLVMPDGLDRQPRASLRPAVGGVSRVRVANDSGRTHAVECLQIACDLLEHIETARTVHLADVRRHDDTRCPS